MKKRALQPNADGTAKSPFLYDPNALGSLRPDQVPRFFAALTDRDNLPVQTFDLADLVAMQDRVDPNKVATIAALDQRPGDPVVIGHDGRLYIADGHHRLSGDWLAGETRVTARFKDLEPVSNVLKRGVVPANAKRFELSAKVAKVSEEIGVVFGWAIVCKIDGEEYFDLNRDPDTGEAKPDHIPESTMLKAAADFMANSRMAKEMHTGEHRGEYLFALPLTTDIAKALGLSTNKTGLIVGLKPDAAMLEKFKSGELGGFSIGGGRIEDEEIDDDEDDVDD